MISLVSNFDKINFSNYTIEKVDNEKILGHSIYDLTVDNYFKVRYTHFLEDENYAVPTKTKDAEGTIRNISFANIRSYIEDIYNKRCARMEPLKNNLAIVIHIDKDNNRYFPSYTNEKLAVLKEICKEKNIICLVIGNTDLCDIKSDDLNWPIKAAKYIYQNDMLA